jgi:hypothetical protein
MKTNTRKKAVRSSRIEDVVVVSDTHCGCRLGLCSPDGMPIDDGGEKWKKSPA